MPSFLRVSWAAGAAMPSFLSPHRTRTSHVLAVRGRLWSRQLCQRPAQHGGVQTFAGRTRQVQLRRLRELLLDETEDVGRHVARAELLRSQSITWTFTWLRKDTWPFRRRLAWHAVVSYFFPKIAW